MAFEGVAWGDPLFSNLTSRDPRDLLETDDSWRTKCSRRHIVSPLLFLRWRTEDSRLPAPWRVPYVYLETLASALVIA